MPVLTLRPNEVVDPGIWTVIGPGGTNVANALADDDDSTYIRCTTLAAVDGKLCKVGLSDVDLPDGSRIFSVGFRARTKQVPPTTDTGGGTKPTPICLIILIQKVIYYAITKDVVRFWRTVLRLITPHPPAPPKPTDPPPSATWETVELPKLLQHPAGGEWTEQSFNEFVLAIGRDSADDASLISSIYVDIDYNTPPVATITDPSGTITDTTTPTAHWTYADQEQDRQQSWQVRVFSAAQYGAAGFDPLTSIAFCESGWTVGEDNQWTITKDLTNSAGPWRAYVQVQQVWLGFGQHRSIPTYVQWAQNVPGPPQPSLTAFYDAELNRVRLELAEGGPSPATISYNIESSDDAGLTYDYVRNGYQIGVSVDGTAQLADYEAPAGQLRKYRAQAFRQLGGIRVASGFSNVVDVVPDSRKFWLKSYLVPTRNMTIVLTADKHSLTRDQGNFKPIVNEFGVARVIPVIGPVYGREGTLTVLFTEKQSQHEARFRQFEALWASGDTLLYQLPNGEQYPIALGKKFETSRWLIGKDGVRFREIVVEYMEVKPPEILPPLEIVTD